MLIICQLSVNMAMAIFRVNISSVFSDCAVLELEVIYDDLFYWIPFYKIEQLYEVVVY